MKKQASGYVAAALLMAISSTATAEDWEISRVYRSSTDFVRAIVKTSRTVDIQCAALDKAGDPLAVSQPQLIRPPMEEVLIRVPETIKNVRCWERAK
jgi:hypothetical protein